MLGLGLDLAYKYVSTNASAFETGLFANLIAYWKMEESSGTRYDSHGSNHLTVYSDDPSAIESGGGVIGNSAIQNDLNENVSLYIAPSPYDAVNSSWSFSFWMSTNDNGDDTNQMFPNAWSNCCLWRIRTLEGDAHQTVEGGIWYDELGAGTSFNANKAGIYEGGFVHVAVTHDLSTKTVRVYYNGIEEHVFVYNIKLSSVSPGNNYENTLLSMFAGDVSGTQYPGPGKLDEVGIWGRVLTAPEITALYNSGVGLEYENFSYQAADPNSWDVSGLNLQNGLYTKQYWGYFNDSNAFFNDRNIAELGPSDIGYYQITRIGDLFNVEAWAESGFYPEPQYDRPESLGEPFPAVGKGVYYFYAGGSPIDPGPNNRVGPALKSEEVASVVYGNYSAVPNNESLIIRGYFKPNISGLHTFKLASDDASYLWLGPNAFDVNRSIGNSVVSLPGLHGIDESTGTFYMVANRYYPLTIEFGNGPEGAGQLYFQYMTPGSSVYSSDLTGKITYNFATKGH
jgi:hypothetical protein